MSKPRDECNGNRRRRRRVELFNSAKRQDTDADEDELVVDQEGLESDRRINQYRAAKRE